MNTPLTRRGEQHRQTNARQAMRDAPSAPPPVSPPGAEPPTRSPVSFLLFWFVIPLIVVLTLQYFHVFERVSEWFGSD